MGEGFQPTHFEQERWSRIHSHVTRGQRLHD